MTNSNLFEIVRGVVGGSLKMAKDRAVKRQLRGAVDMAVYWVVNRAVNRDVSWAAALFWDPSHPRLARYLNELPR
jgi:hypothetical protein